MLTMCFLLALAALMLWPVLPLRRFLHGALAGAAMLAALALPAVAQTFDAGAGIIAAVLPQLLEIAGLILMAALTWAAAWAKRKWGIEIEAKHRDALHSALMTGARLAVARQLSGKAAIEAILGYVRDSVPDALGNLAPSPATLLELAEAKLHSAKPRMPN